MRTELIEAFEKRLDSFDACERRRALEALKEEAASGRIALPKAGQEVNLHCHTFFSYNCYGYSPSKIAWLGRKRGLVAAGIVDFDVLDGLDEFFDAASLIGLKGCGGFETRVFVPEFAKSVINSPGEPGIAYHSAAGMPSGKLSDAQKFFINRLRNISSMRNTDLIKRVNEYLKPVVLDYEKEVLSLTPSGNATERHICLAYARKAQNLFAERKPLAEFWSEKLKIDISSLDLPEGQKFLDIIRSRTMKRGSVGYVQPDKGAFPTMQEVNRFIIEAGGIPTLPWLNGTSEAEQQIERLLAVVMKSGVAAVNIVPARNITSDEKIDNLKRTVPLADKLGLPIIVGTEMNSPGQKFVDNFESKGLSSLADVFLKGAYIVYGHTVLQRGLGLGYLSEWAESNFKDTAEKNEFYEQFGRLFSPGQEYKLRDLQQGIKPQELLKLTGD